jgi:hypothetical protein
MTHKERWAGARKLADPLREYPATLRLAAMRYHGDNQVSKPKTESKMPTNSRERRSLPIPCLLQILVECQSESQQRDLYERLRQEGYRCRVLTL